MKFLRGFRGLRICRYNGGYLIARSRLNSDGVYWGQNGIWWHSKDRAENFSTLKEVVEKIESMYDIKIKRKSK